MESSICKERLKCMGLKGIELFNYFFFTLKKLNNGALCDQRVNKSRSSYLHLDEAC